MSRRLVIWSSVVVTAVILAIAGYFLFLQTGKPSGNGSPAGTTQPNEAIPSADLQTLQNAINSSEKNDQASALATQPRELFSQQAQLLLPSGQQIYLEPSTSATNGNDGRVDATILTCETNSQCVPTGTHYTLRLIREIDGKWRILYLKENK